ncbi:hypothetical protein P153DRAFT_381277 [Dothidotthia symphoricarpi CBS 119687]|uniref:Uncharacterized protein n=1 Tax=Dothidotthia symphoricarpi CBS 119687 TaxID=1392245 RepID=A0A6A6AQN7_9PLEO|nr:uncharacterized protein P153DRAFT_381277 [Dothidotthia symphoricarpi CBS 119687]KAF2134100.1 hypothetical protein P153DRAFT_381277 [Dothidotthia symphoricarpi CBS 119687]
MPSPIIRVCSIGKVKRPCVELSILDAVLDTATAYHNGIYHLPINAYTNGARPVADKSPFSRLLINGEINNVHAKHVAAALECIGEYVEHLRLQFQINAFAPTGADEDLVILCRGSLPFAYAPGTRSWSLVLEFANFYVWRCADVDCKRINVGTRSCKDLEHGLSHIGELL